jgi:hypothetical protein
MPRQCTWLLVALVLHLATASTNPILIGERPLTACQNDPLSTTFPLSITSITVARQPRPMVWNGQLRLGEAFSFSITGTVPVSTQQISTHDIKTSLSLSAHTSSLSGVEASVTSSGEYSANLCTMLGYNTSSQPSRCPIVAPSTTKINAVRTFNLQSAAGQLMVPTRKTLAAGVYNAQLQMSYHFNNATFYTCVDFQQVFVSSWLDYIPAVVSFTIASAASWHLGKAFPSIKLPIITGYLMIGVVVGPYVTNLVTKYHVWLLGQIINDVALSFIAFAAGEEIFFPELRDVLSTILRQMKFITVATMFLVCTGFYMIANNSDVLGNWVTSEPTSCQIGIVLLLGIIMVGRSK